MISIFKKVKTLQEQLDRLKYMINNPPMFSIGDSVSGEGQTGIVFEADLKKRDGLFYIYYVWVYTAVSTKGLYFKPDKKIKKLKHE